MHGEISRAKNLLLSPDSYERSADHAAGPLIAAVWRESETELRCSDAFEFDDLLAFAVRLLVEQPHRRPGFASAGDGSWSTSSRTQATPRPTLVDLLAGTGRQRVRGGDDDQLVHGWRGRRPAAHPRVRRTPPGSHARIVLAANFRRCAEILDAALALRSPQPAKRREGVGRDARRGGGQVRVRRLLRGLARGAVGRRQVAEAIEPACRRPRSLDRWPGPGYATEPLQDALARAGIPHRVLGSSACTSAREVRDALAYLTLLVNPRDAQAFRRAIQSPRRGVGPATANLVVTRARESRGGDLIAASAGAAAIERVPSAAARGRLVQFGVGLQSVRAELDSGRSLGHVAIAVVTLPGGLVAHHEYVRDHSQSPERRSRCRARARGPAVAVPRRAVL